MGDATANANRETNDLQADVEKLLSEIEQTVQSLNDFQDEDEASDAPEQVAQAEATPKQDESDAQAVVEAEPPPAEPEATPVEDVAETEVEEETAPVSETAPEPEPDAIEAVDAVEGAETPQPQATSDAPSNDEPDDHSDGDESLSAQIEQLIGQAHDGDEPTDLSAPERDGDGGAPDSRHIDVESEEDSRSAVDEIMSDVSRIIEEEAAAARAEAEPDADVVTDAAEVVAASADVDSAMQAAEEQVKAPESIDEVDSQLAAEAEGLESSLDDSGSAEGDAEIDAELAAVLGEAPVDEAAQDEVPVIRIEAEAATKAEKQPSSAGGAGAKRGGGRRKVGSMLAPARRLTGVAALAAQAISVPLQRVTPAQRDLVGWIGVTIVFWGVCVWLYILLR